jgi:hypothetical protein
MTSDLDRLYYEDSIDLLATDDHPGIVDRHSDDAMIGQAVETARAILTAAGYDMTLPPNLLLEPTKKQCWGHHFAARVLYHARGMDRAVKAGRTLDVRKHAMYFAKYLERAKHLEAWGDNVVKHQRRAEASRSNLADHNRRLQNEAERYWSPWRAKYHELLGKGWSDSAARAEIATQIGGSDDKEPDESTLRKWLR